MKTVSALILLSVILMGTLTVVLNSTAASTSGTITVPDDYETIQEAINAANSGGTIVVKAGTYNEEWISVNKTVSLVGDNQKSLVYYHSGTGFIVTANNVQITGFTITNFEELKGYAISLANANSCVIENNLIADNLVGISVYAYSSDNTVCGNVLDHNERSIELINAHTNAISENNITAALVSGISLDLSSGNLVSKNRISELNDELGALMLWQSSYNTIYRNLLFGGTMMLLLGSSNNVASENFVMDSDYGVFVGSSSGNTFHSNYFINVTELASDTESSTGQLSENSWDNGVEGNYWSSYNGEDADSNGIGDSAHVLYGSNLDNYPLMDYPEVSTNPITDSPQTTSSSSTASDLPAEALYLILVAIAIIVAAVTVIKLKK